MNNLLRRVALVDRLASVEQSESATPTMVVGDLINWEASGQELPKIDGFVFVDFDDVTIEIVGKVEPQVILSPLLGRTFDAVEIARRLTQMGYRGRYRVITDGVPDAEVVTREVTEIAPELDFAILNLASITPES